MSAAEVPAETTEGLPGAGGLPPAQQNEKDEEGGHELTVEERVRQDPDFAVAQIKARDAKVSEFANRVKQFEPLKPFIEAAGGAENLLTYAHFGQQVRQVPGLLEIVQKAIQEGRVTAPEPPANDPNDEWLDDDTKRIRDELRGEIGELKQLIQSATGLAQSASLRSQESHIQRNIGEAVKAFEKVADGREEALSLIEQRVKRAHSMAEQGDAQQRQILEQLAGPEGTRVLKYMLLEEGLFDKYGSQIYTTTPKPPEENAGPGVKQTDGKTVNPSRPGAPPIPPLEKGQRVTNDIAMNIYREITRRRGRSVA